MEAHMKYKGQPITIIDLVFARDIRVTVQGGEPCPVLKKVIIEDSKGNILYISPNEITTL